MACKRSGVRIPIAPPRSEVFFELLIRPLEGRTAAKYSSGPCVPTGDATLLAGGREGTVADQNDSALEPLGWAPLVTAPGTALDPMVALATSVHASPGVYALLLGSGISTATGIPTGWQVVTDLVQKAAAAQNPTDPEALSATAEDPEAWRSQQGDGKPLGYSALLNTLAPTPAAAGAACWLL
jgi:hypothetical protein